MAQDRCLLVSSEVSERWRGGGGGEKEREGEGERLTTLLSPLLSVLKTFSGAWQCQDEGQS